jgi:DHA1 family tetracycline resistance protein-like MFS transporter
MQAALDYATPDPSQPPRRALAIIFLIVFMDLLGFGVIIPQLPFYATAYNASALGVTILFSIYSACQFIAAPILGSMSDRWGRRPVLVFSQIGSVLGYVLLGMVPLIHWSSAAVALGVIYLSRVIDGLSGGNISTAQAYISDVTTPANRAKGMGLLGAAFGIGFSVGPALGGIVGGEGRQHWPAFVAAALAGIAALLTYLYLPESRHRANAAAVAMASTAERDVDAPVRDDADAAALSESRPGLLDRFGVRAVIGRPILVHLLLIGFASMVAFIMMESCLALFLAQKDTFGFGSRQVGWYFAFVGVIITCVQGGLIGRLTRLGGEWSLAISGPILVAVGMACYVQIGWAPVLWLLGVAGATNAIGRSLQQPTLSSLISKFSDHREQGVVFGLFHGMSSLARVIGPVIAGILYERHPTGPFALAGVMALAIGVWTMLLSAASPKPSRPPEPAPGP